MQGHKVEKPRTGDLGDEHDHESYIPSETNMREFSFRAVLTGTILGMIFGASSLYLVLKVGITVSASIPVAVISITLFRGMSKLFGMKDATILEHNIVQTSGSAGESLAFGVGVTMPAIMILGFELELTRVMLVALLGGLLGVLMMIPLRRALIVRQHKTLKYPEGTACAEVLKAGASPESRAMASPGWREEANSVHRKELQRRPSAATIFTGFGVGIIYNFLMKGCKFWKDVPEKIFGAPFKGASVASENTPELLGIGYIIGPTIASIMCGGGVLSYLVLIPMIKFFGDSLAGPLPPGKIPISEMSPDEVRGAYVLYIGAGAVAAGGIISLIRSAPLIWHGIREGLRDVGRSRDEVKQIRRRTDHDLPMSVVLWGIIALVAAITIAPTLHMNIVGAIMIVLFGFLFVTVSSRLTGEIGSSSNPISGMTVATLLLTCLVFYFLGWRGGTYYVTALSVGAIVCIASSNGGTISQDLKTGYLVGATPRYQQIAILFGVIASALVLGPILLRLNDAATVYVPLKAGELKTDSSKLTLKESLKGPQANLDANTYFVWHKVEPQGGGSAKYLVDNNGNAVYLVDPGINGTVKERPDKTAVRKFSAPKATLMSYIIQGILDQRLPWGLVLVGVMIAIVLEMSSIPSLAFAVGVYLQLSTSMPVFIGGLIRWLVDRKRARDLLHLNLDKDELAADADRSPGVLAASGYIAGGALAGIFIAIVQGWSKMEGIDTFFTEISKRNPFFEGAHADALSLIPFLLLIGFLFLVGREKLLKDKSA
jgi:putative OPT family oligopeptide transporter